MLGVFLLGLLTRRQANLTNIPSMLIVIGTAITFVMGYLLGPVMAKRQIHE